MNDLKNDQYGRTVLKSESMEEDCYLVNGLDGQEDFIVKFPMGTALEQVYSTINAMAPSGYVKPDPDGGV